MYHSTPIRMTKTQNTVTTKCWWGLEQQELTLIAGEECKIVWYSHFASSLAVSYKTKQTLSIQSSSRLLGIYTNELKTYFHTKTFTQMFIAALFIIVKTWNKRCPSVAEWMNKFGTSRQRNILFRPKKKWTLKSWKDTEES